PKLKFGEAIAFCAANGSKPTVAVCDTNSRIGQENTTTSILPRTSSDNGENPRGSRFLGLCEQNHLEILNGTSFEKSSPGALTCFQSNGSSVVDYALLSRSHLGMLPPRSLEIV
ncbi:hypothetical protein DFH07DRAFT_841156, partial [Mycena maculata]